MDEGIVVCRYDVWMYECMDVWMYVGWIDCQLIDECMDTWMDKCMKV